MKPSIAVLALAVALPAFADDAKPIDHAAAAPTKKVVGTMSGGVMKFGQLEETLGDAMRRRDRDALDPRYNGYSVGRWEDDYTFVVDTTGLAPDTWATNSGYPHSVDAHVQERFHRDSMNDLTLTITMDDSKLYTKPFYIGDVHFRWIPNQMLDDYNCIPSELQLYLKEMGDPAGSDPNAARR